MEVRPIYLFAAAFGSESTGHDAAYDLLACALLRAWGWNRTPPLRRNASGKPSFLDRPDRYFNLSHTAGLCLCALSDSGPVGVDIERVRPRRPALPRYVMSPNELQCFDGSWEDFARIWTLKEAFVKLQGTSIFPPDLVPVPPPVPYRSYAGPGWRAALCAEADCLPDIQWVEL